MPGTESRSSHSCWGSGHLKFQGIQGKGAEARDKSSGCERLNSGFVKFQIQLSYESKQGRRDSSSQVYVTGVLEQTSYLDDYLLKEACVLRSYKSQVKTQEQKDLNVVVGKNLGIKKETDLPFTCQYTLTC